MAYQAGTRAQKQPNLALEVDENNFLPFTLRNLEFSQRERRQSLVETKQKQLVQFHVSSGGRSCVFNLQVHMTLISSGAYHTTNNCPRFLVVGTQREQTIRPCQLNSLFFRLLSFHKRVSRGQLEC